MSRSTIDSHTVEYECHDRIRMLHPIRRFHETVRISDMTDEMPQRLLLDVMLGKLAVYLRFCGYDAAYAGDRGFEEDDALRHVASCEDRHVLSRDRQLIASLDEATVLNELEIDAQLEELLAAGFSLDPADPPQRCGRCNGRLEPEPEAGSRPPYAPSDRTEPCWQCCRCGQYFWRGSHFDDMAETLSSIPGTDD